MGPRDYIFWGRSLQQQEPAGEGGERSEGSEQTQWRDGDADGFSRDDGRGGRRQRSRAGRGGRPLPRGAAPGAHPVGVVAHMAPMPDSDSRHPT